MIRTLGSTIVFLCAIALILGGMYGGLYWITFAGIALIVALVAGI